MENYLVVIILSVFVLLGALYVTIGEQKIIKIKDELLQHGYEITLESTRKELTQVKVEFELTNKALIQVKVELESTRQELKQVQVELESTKKELKQAQFELESTKTEVKEAQVELKSTRNELQQVKVELESTKREVKQVKVELESTKKEDKQVQIEMESTKKAVKLVKVELDKIITDHTSIPAFTATLSKDSTPPVNQIIIFDSVKTNVGGHYSPSTGVFTSPRNGLYMISATMRSTASKHLHCELWVNESMKVKTFGTNYSTGTINAVLQLKTGDKVFIKKDQSSGEHIIGREWSMFSGYFIA